MIDSVIVCVFSFCLRSGSSGGLSADLQRLVAPYFPGMILARNYLGDSRCGNLGKSGELILVENYK